MKKESSKKLHISKIKIANLSENDAKKKHAPTTTVLASIKTWCLV
jgi:hypothetical protein